MELHQCSTNCTLIHLNFRQKLSLLLYLYCIYISHIMFKYVNCDLVHKVALTVSGSSLFRVLVIVLAATEKSCSHATLVA
ncbi:hypothetical protein C1646_705588 [Rhizophagus diaphanus]|nr:hypothetical protein C1646_705588 [Rhizophagus diaphanus] [Rhizophagus sp. MUCL 43196]